MLDYRTVSDIMVKDVVAVHPDTPLLEANAIIQKHQFNGVPVVDEAHKLLGILTDYDLISSDAALHLPTVQKLIGNLPVQREDRSAFINATATLRNLTVKEVMNTDPLTLPDGASIEEVITVFRTHHRVNPVPVIDKDHKVVGVVSRYDLLALITAFL